MKGLVVRLIELADAHERLEQGGGASEELYEAAAEIELLSAKVARLEARGITDMQYEIERLRAENAELKEWYPYTKVEYWDLQGMLGDLLRWAKKLPEPGDSL